MAVQFSYMQQNPDGSVTTHGATAERAPTWGELQDHVASSGATLLPATPAAQPPPAPREEEAPPPAAAPPAAPPPTLPTAVTQTGGHGPTPVNPPRALGTYVLPAASAGLGAWALPATAMALTAPVGPLSWPAIAGLAALGAYGGGFTGELAQAETERSLYGEPPPGSPTPVERGLEFGKTAGQTEALVQTASPLVMPAVRAIARPFGSTALRSSSEAGPLLRTGGLLGAGGATENAAVEGGQEVLGRVVHDFDVGHAAQSARVGPPAPNVLVSTEGLPPLVASTRDALARQGATAEQLALFDKNMVPLTQGGTQPLHAVLGAERNLNRWAANMPGNLTLPELDALATSTRNTIGAGVEGTPAAQPWKLHTDMQAATAPTRTAMREAANTMPGSLQPYFATPDGQLALRAVIDHGTSEDIATMGKAWLASTRQAARTAADPVKYVADAYEALPVGWRSAMFGDQTPALGQLIGAATGASSRGVRLPLVGTVPIAQPWARSVLMSPRAAAATNVLGKSASGIGRTGLYTGVAQAGEEKPPAGP